MASLPKSFDILVTALEASPDVPKMEIVTERLLHEDSKQKINKPNEYSIYEDLMQYTLDKVRGNFYTSVSCCIYSDGDV